MWCFVRTGFVCLQNNGKTWKNDLCVRMEHNLGKLFLVGTLMDESWGGFCVKLPPCGNVSLVWCSKVEDRRP